MLRGDITEPANWRNAKPFDDWLKSHDLPGICDVDTREITRRRARRRSAQRRGRPCAATAGSTFPRSARTARDWPGLDGMDLAIEVSTKQTYQWNETTWALGKGYGTLDKPRYHIVAVDFGIKRNILRCLRQGRLRGDGGAGDGDGRGRARAEARRRLPLERPRRSGRARLTCTGDPASSIGKMPIFGICLGHQMLGYALGGKTYKLKFGHRGGNQPVKDLRTGKVEITSQNHGFCGRSTTRCRRMSRSRTST